MDVARSLNCREMKKCDVVDTSGEKIGRIGDMTFKFVNGILEPSQFILVGSVWEEFLESIGAKPDIDPVFDVSLIHKLGDKVTLNTSKNSLKTTLDEGVFSDDEIKLSSFEDLDIIDENGIKVGRAIDVDFNIDGTASVIVGGGFIEESLESWGIKEDIDIIVPSTTIESITDKVKLKVSKDELALTMDEALKSPEVKKAREEKTTSQDVMKVRLFSQRPF